MVAYSVLPIFSCQLHTLQSGLGRGDRDWKIATVRLLCALYVKACPDRWLAREAHPTEGSTIPKGGEIQAI